MIEHYEYLSCGHQNNLLIKDKDGKLRNTKGICPKGCTNVERVTVVDNKGKETITELSSVEQ